MRYLSIIFLLAASAAADDLILKDGTTLSGQVVEEGNHLNVVDRDRKYVVKKSQVKSRVEARHFMDEYDARMAKLPDDDADAIFEFGKWLEENEWSTRAHRAYEEVLELDTDHRAARRALGYRLYEGEWVSPDELNRQKGLVQFEGRWYTKHDIAQIQKRLTDNEDFRRTYERRKRANDKLNSLVSRFKSLWKNKRQDAYQELYAYAEGLNSPELRKFADDTKAYYDNMAAVICANYRARTEIHATRTKLRKPIETFTTTLGAAIGAFSAQSPVRIQLPELAIAEIHTTVEIPAACK
ncbi:MAG: hypothetical protein V3T86_14650 [Planctomycetota bacterium]